MKLLDLPTSSSSAGWHRIQSFVACPKEYQFLNVRGLTYQGAFLRSPLARGVLIHAARAQWLHDGRSPDSPWQAQMLKTIKDCLLKDKQRINPVDHALAIEDFRGYVSFWSKRPVTKVLAVEYPLHPRGLQPGAPAWAHRTARLDSIELHHGKAWIGECKSTSSSPSRVIDQYALNGQTLLQMALWGPDETAKFGELGGVLFDIIVKSNGSKASRGVFPRAALPVERVSHALAWFRKNFPAWVMQASMIQWNDDVPRNITACMRPHGACDFREMCMKGRDGSSRFVLGETKQSLMKWKPTIGKEVPPWT